MPGPIDFYFDFISPYGYLGSVGIEQVAARHGREVDWRPMLLGIAVLKVMGLKPLMQTPLKADYLRKDIPRAFRLAGVPMKFADEAPAPLPAARAFVWLKRRDPAAAKRLAQALYRAQWSEGRAIGTPEAVAAIAAEHGLERGAVLAATADPAVKDLLAAEVQASIERGVFGSPTFFVDGEMFWGHDRLAHVERWLETGGW